MKIKNGFSLIEVLLVLGIVAVVTAMGFSISKKGMENAYNLYWYTGYVTLYDSLVDWNNRNPEGIPSALNYAHHLWELVRSEDTEPTGSDPGPFRAPNGIIYDMQEVPDGQSSFIQIDMSIPQHKQRNGAAPNRTVFVYFPDGTVPMVYPADTAQLTNQDPDLVNLHNRADLLMFVRRGGGINDDVRRTLYSFHDGYCAVYGTLPNHADPANISCTTGPDSFGGTLRPVNPRKAY